MIRSYTPAAVQEVEKTLQEFREGRLVVGTTARVPVTSLRLALVIGWSRARRKGFAHARHRTGDVSEPEASARDLRR